MDEDEEIQPLLSVRFDIPKRVKDEVKKCLRHASFELGKAAQLPTLSWNKLGRNFNSVIRPST